MDDITGVYKQGRHRRVEAPNEFSRHKYIGNCTQFQGDSMNLILTNVWTQGEHNGTISSERRGGNIMADHILIVEDEKLLLEVLCDYFHAKGDDPTGISNGADALEYLENNSVDAVLLDILMPELDGFSVCRAVRRRSNVPIIFLTALSDEEDKLRGYELGADDYVTKPYSMAVLYAKTKALIARSRGSMVVGGLLSAGDIQLDINTHHVTIGGVVQELPNREFKLLQCFMENKNQVLTREQLLSKVWGYDYEGDDRTVDTHVKKLRARGVQIETVIRVGYRFREG